MSDKVLSLMDRIRKLPPADKLRLAAEMLDNGKDALAAETARLALEELDAKALLGRLRTPPREMVRDGE